MAVVNSPGYDERTMPKTGKRFVADTPLARLLVEHLGPNPNLSEIERLSREQGIPLLKSSLSGYLLGTKTTISTETARRLAQFTKTPEELWLRAGNATPASGGVGPDTTRDLIVTTIKEALEGITIYLDPGEVPGTIPLRTTAVRVLRDAASVGSARTHAEGDEIVYPVQPSELDHRLVGVEVRGDCLEPSGVLTGMIAVVDLSVRPRSGEIVLARRGDELLVKRLRVDRGHPSIRHLDADQHWEPLLVDDGVEVLGVCLAFMTRLPRKP